MCFTAKITTVNPSKKAVDKALGSERQRNMKPPVPRTARMTKPQDPAN